MMKQVLFCILYIAASFTVYAQDLIILRNGDEIPCKVQLLSKEDITYITNGSRNQIASTQIYMIKYEARGNVFFNTDGEATFNSESVTSKLKKNDISIFLCKGEEIIASEINITANQILYKIPNNKLSSKILSKITKKSDSNDWQAIPKDEVFLVRFFDGTKNIINNLSELELLQRKDAVKHPFVPINKDPKYPCPAEIELKDGVIFQVIIYDLEREYVHFRKKDWQDGPIFRIRQNIIKTISTTN